MLSQGSPKALILKLRIKATLEFWTFQPPLRRPGLQANTYAGVVHRERENGMRKSAHSSMHTASTCTAGSNGGGARRAGKAYRESIGACRRCRSPAMGMSVPEARTRVTPFESHQLRDYPFGRYTNPFSVCCPKADLACELASEREQEGNAAFGCAADERRAALALSAAAATGLTFKALPPGAPAEQSHQRARMLAAYKWRGDERAGRTSTAGTHACTAEYAQRLAVQRAQEKEHRSHARTTTAAEPHANRRKGGMFR